MAEPLRVLATADLHVADTLGLAGLHPTGPGGQPLVLEQARATLGWIGDLVFSEGPDVVIVAGDVYSTPRPSPACQAVVQEALAAWADSGALVVVLLGNHDRPNGGGVHALEPLRYLRPEPRRHMRPGRIVVVDDFEPLVIVSAYPDVGELDVLRSADVAIMEGAERPPLAIIYPLPYPSRADAALHASTVCGTLQEVGAGLGPVVRAHALLAQQARESHPGVPQILIGHGTVEGAEYGGQTSPLADVPIPVEHFDAFDAALWGHIHAAQPIGPHSQGHCYVGSADRQTFGEAGLVPGVMIIDFEPGGAPGVMREKNPAARMFATMTPGEFAAAPQDAELWPGLVARVTGDVTEEEHAEISTRVRAMVRQGHIIANQTVVPRVARARAELDPSAGVDDVLSAVFRVRPDLAAQEDSIRAKVRDLMEE